MSEIKTDDPKRGIKLRGADKTSASPSKSSPLQEKLKKPEWIRAKLPSRKFADKDILREQDTPFAREASCPNIGECFSKGTTLHDYGRYLHPPLPVLRRGTRSAQYARPHDEPKNLAESVKAMNLRYVVITSVDRDDLRDGGAQLISPTASKPSAKPARTQNQSSSPTSRGRLDITLKILAETPPDVMNHNLRNPSSLYRKSPSGASQHSLDLLKRYKEMMPHIPTKSGVMVNGRNRRRRA